MTIACTSDDNLVDSKLIIWLAGGRMFWKTA